MRNPAKLTKERPAESGTVVIAALMVLLNAIYPLSDEVKGALFIVLAFVPTAITWLVDTIRK